MATAELTMAHIWRHSFRTLGFAYVIVGAIMAMIGILGISHPMNCPIIGCIYNPAWEMAGLSLPAGLTLITSGIIVRWPVSVESERKDREFQ